MAKYKFKKGTEVYYVEASNKSKARKEVCKQIGFKITKFDADDFDESIYYQRHSRYKGWKLGNSNTSMQNYGCALMCWSYVARLDPKDVDKLFIDKGVYNNDMINFGKACKVLGFKDYEKSTDINRMPIEKETIKEVLLGRSQHFVVRINDNGRRIFDPWLGKILPINHYKFKSYRIFK